MGEECIAESVKAYLDFEKKLKDKLPKEERAAAKPTDISGGAMDGQFLTYEQVLKLKNLPNKLELIATIARLIKQVRHSLVWIYRRCSGELMETNIAHSSHQQVCTTGLPLINGFTATSLEPWPMLCRSGAPASYCGVANHEAVEVLSWNCRAQIRRQNALIVQCYPSRRDHKSRGDHKSGL